MFYHSGMQLMPPALPTALMRNKTHACINLFPSFIVFFPYPCDFDEDLQRHFLIIGETDIK